MKPALLELLRRIRERHDRYNGFSISPESELAKDIDSMTWSALEDFCSFLKAFKEGTLPMSASEYPTLCWSFLCIFSSTNMSKKLLIQLMVSRLHTR
jgi:hypothetical protein